MKLLHFAPALHPGSASRLAVDLAYALQVHGVQSVLLSPDAEGILPIPGAAHQLWRQRSLLGDWGLVRRMARMIRQLRPDIVQAYGCEGVRLAARALRQLPKQERPRLVGALTGHPAPPDFFHRPEAAAADALTVVARYLRRYAEEQGAPPQTLRVIPYGVDETQCYPSYTPPPNSAPPLPEDRFVICLPGPVSPLHGTPDVIPILRDLLQRGVPAHAVLAGEAPRCRAALEARIEAAGLREHISWLGACPQMRDVLCRAQAVLSLTAAPAAYDRPVLEALALGCPVAGYAHGIIAEYLQAFLPAGALPAGDTAAAAELLARWHAAPPPPLTDIPYPYRLSDTAQTYYNLYTTLL